MQDLFNGTYWGIINFKYCLDKKFKSQIYQVFVMYGFKVAPSLQ